MCGVRVVRYHDYTLGWGCREARWSLKTHLAESQGVSRKGQSRGRGRIELPLLLTLSLHKRILTFDGQGRGARRTGGNRGTRGDGLAKGLRDRREGSPGMGLRGRRGDGQVLADQILHICLRCEPLLTALRSGRLNFDVVEEGQAPLMYRELGAKAKEIMLEEKGREDRAIRVLKGHHDGGGGMGEEGARGADPRRQLSHPKATVSGVVTKKGLVARFSGMHRGNLSHTSGNVIDKNLAPLDIWAGGEWGGGRQGGLDGPDNEVMGSVELGQRCLQTGEHN
jgi:hypothetical protein